MQTDDGGTQDVYLGVGIAVGVVLLATIVTGLIVGFRRRSYGK